MLLLRRIRTARARASHFLDPYGRPSFSQEGEDMVVQRLLEGRPAGTYVDVGAHHPSRFSNTRLLYDAGWRGLNIDALPGSMELFRKRRPRDVSLEVGVAKEKGSATFWQFVEPALSTFEERVARERLADGHALVREVEVAVDTLAGLVSTHLGTSPIDFLTVDVEGRDLEVLVSLDWGRQRPGVVCVESQLGICDMSSGPAAFLVEHGYELYAATGLSRIFVSR